MRNLSLLLVAACATAPQRAQTLTHPSAPPIAWDGASIYDATEDQLPDAAAQVWRVVASPQELSSPPENASFAEFNEWAQQHFTPWVREEQRRIQRLDAAFESLSSSRPLDRLFGAITKAILYQRILDTIPPPAEALRDPQLLALYQSAFSGLEGLGVTVRRALRQCTRIAPETPPDFQQWEDLCREMRRRAARRHTALMSPEIVVGVGEQRTLSAEGVSAYQARPRWESDLSQSSTAQVTEPGLYLITAEEEGLRMIRLKGDESTRSASDGLVTIELGEGTLIIIGP
ncbi:MAG: hypothetical protein AAGE52_23630 [Myxococcota bacterium]